MIMVLSLLRIGHREAQKQEARSESLIRSGNEWDQVVGGTPNVCI